MASAWDTYNNNVKNATPSWMNTAGGIGKGAAGGAGLGTAIFPGIGTVVGGVLGAIGGGLNAVWQNKQAQRQNDFMSQQFEQQKKKEEEDIKDRRRQMNINTLALMRSNIRESIYGTLTGRW